METVNKLTYANGDTYLREWINGMKHGKGKYTMLNVCVYDGLWEYDVKCGQGKMTFGDRNGRDKIELFYVDMRKGNGQQMYLTGCFSEGEWKDDKFLNGKAKHQYSNGDNYEGGWKDGMKYGSGKYIYINPNVSSEYVMDDEYVGQFKDDKRHGKGKCTYPDRDHNSVFHADMSNGSCAKPFNGFGVCYSEGDWVDDKFFSGKAKHQYSNGDQYEGEWKDGVKHGNGKYTKFDSYTYEGDFFNGKRDGMGKCLYLSSNHQYVGAWKNDMRVGNGKIYYSNGDIYEGEWYNDKRHGQAKCTYTKQASNDGKQWNADMHNGDGISPFKCLPDCYSEGEWVDGKFLNGKARHQYSNGEQYEGEWKNGAKCV